MSNWMSRRSQSCQPCEFWLLRVLAQYHLSRFPAWLRHIILAFLNGRIYWPKSPRICRPVTTITRKVILLQNGTSPCFLFPSSYWCAFYSFAAANPISATVAWPMANLLPEERTVWVYLPVIGKSACLFGNLWIRSCLAAACLQV